MKQAMIFAAGLGTRLKPLTDTMPKALVRVGGEPLLKLVILRLRDAGFTRFVVNVHHFARQITDYLDANGRFGLDIRISDETEGLLDTGGGIRKAAPLFDAAHPILVHNVDILSNADLGAFYALDADAPCDGGDVPPGVGARLLVSRRKTGRYLLFDRRMRLVGWLNTVTGEVRSPYPEVREAAGGGPLAMGPDGVPTLPGGLWQAYAFSGIHSFSPALFPYMEGQPERFSIMGFYLGLCHRLTVKGHVAEGLEVVDVGKTEVLDRLGAGSLSERDGRT